MIYAVCTRCAFLRAYSQEASEEQRLEKCPACAGELITRERAGRFPPAYVSRISFELLAAPELQQQPPAQ